MMAKTEKRRKPGRRQQTKKKTSASKSAVVKSREVSSKDSSVEKDSQEEFTTTISMHLEPNLFVTIEQMLDSRQIAGDYSWASVADFVREAILDHAQGMKLEVGAVGRRTKRFSIRAGQTVTRHWELLPTRKKAEILDRVLRTKLSRL